MAAEVTRSVLGLLAAAALVWAPGALLARIAGWRGDCFRRFLAGTLLWSTSGLLVAEIGEFSFAGAAALAIAGALFAGLALRALKGKGAEEKPVALAWVFGILACGAALTYLPPYDTFIAASDSTMYLSAGVHLARSGAMKVPDRIGAELSPFQRHRNFPSVGFLGRGPFIRLPGGLLKANRDDPEAVPAFFPLAPVWVALFTSLGDLPAGPLVAPLFEALTVWAVCLFAAEVGGALAGAATWLFLLGNFALWWYGRFLLSEPLASFFVWAGLVELARSRSGDRRALALAGAALAAAGFARTETLVLTAAAAALVVTWGRRGPVGARRFWPGLVAWLAVAFWVALQVAVNPSHHQAYFSSDLAFARLRLSLLIGPAWPGRLAATIVVLAALSGFLAWRRGGKVGLYWLRAAVLCGVGGGLGLYALLGGDFSPARGLRWLTAYLGWPALVLSLLGAAQVVRRRVKIPPLGIALWALSTLLFIINPHVALKHPWAIRRFLPEVIPGLLVLAGLGGASLAGVGTRNVRRVAAGCVLVLCAALFQARPILDLWGKPLYRNVLSGLREVNERLEPGANVVVESMLADWQLQVPLWLIYGHETIVAHSPGPYWRGISYALTKTGPGRRRPLYWLTFGPRGYVTPPKVFGLAFKSVAEIPLVAALPAQTIDRPPGGAVFLRANLRLYEISRWDLPVKPRGSSR